jgi:hypothetical protein
MSIQLPNIPALSSKVDSEVRRAFDSIKGWLNKVGVDGGMVTRTSLSQDMALNAALSSLLDTVIPSQCQNLIVTGAFRTIILTWDQPRCSYVEVCRHTSDDLGTATMIGTTQSAMYSDMPPNSSLAVDYYYWVRAVSASGIKGPYNATLGTKGNTANDPAYVLEVLAGKVTSSQLNVALNNRLNMVDDPTTGLVKKTNDLITTYGSTAAAATSASSASTSANSAGNSAIAAASSVTTAQSARDAAAISASAASGSSSSASTSANSAGNSATASYNSATAAATSAGSASTYASNSSTSAGNAATSASSAGTYASNAFGYASAAASSASTASTAAGVITAQYTIKVDANGKIAGIGLWSNGTTSNVEILADRFAIAHTSGGVTRVPFIVDATYGVCMDMALIKTASISSAKIGDLAADKITAGNVTVALNLTTGGLVKSNNYSGTAGWQIDAVGNATFNNLVAYGSLRTAFGTGERMEIDSASHFIKFFNSANAERVFLGTASRDGYNAYGVFGSITAGETRPGLVGLSDSGAGVSGVSRSQYGVFGHAPYGYYGGYFLGGSIGGYASGSAWSFYAAAGGISLSFSTSVATFYAPSSNGSEFSYYSVIASAAATLSKGGYGPFTGAHDALIAFNSVVEEGDIVCDVAIRIKATVSDTLAEVARSVSPKQKTVLGVVATKLPYDTNHIPGTCLSISELVQYITGFDQLIINSVGEGQINVCKDGGNIEAGDYICSSSRPGKGMKQGDDLLHNYTVAKARETAIWSDSEDDIRMIACTYHCG